MAELKQRKGSNPSILRNSNAPSNYSNTGTTIFFDSFESWPGAWTNIDFSSSGGRWKQSPDHYYDGSHSATIVYDPTTNIMQGLRSAVIDLSSFDGQNMELSFFQRGDYNDYYVWHDVSIYANGEISYSELGPATDNWTEVLIDLSDYAGLSNIEIEFYYEGIDGDTWYIDNVTLRTIPEKHIVNSGSCLFGYPVNNSAYLSPGYHELRMEIDPDNHIIEGDETNNSYSRMISVIEDVKDSLDCLFDGIPLTGPAPLLVQFSDTSYSNTPIISWEWTFGDTGKSTLQNPLRTFDSPGKYDVSLIISNGVLNDTLIKKDYIIVEEIPAKEINCAFGATPISGTAPLEVQFQDLSTSTDAIVSWEWTFGDTGKSWLQNPLRTFDIHGNYNVSLIISDGMISDTLIKENYILVEEVNLSLS